MITLTNLEKIYRTKEIETVALENVNLTVNKGEFLSIMGPSGCGKSTLLNIIGLLDLSLIHIYPQGEVQRPRFRFLSCGRQR